MEYEHRNCGGLDWLICRGEASVGSFREAIERLQQVYCRGQAVWAAPGGLWEAIWLAEQYDVPALVLEGENLQRERSPLRNGARRNLFAVVCPVILCSVADAPLFSNAAVYHVPDKEKIPEAVDCLFCERTVNKSREN